MQYAAFSTLLVCAVIAPRTAYACHNPLAALAGAKEEQRAAIFVEAYRHLASPDGEIGQLTLPELDALAIDPLVLKGAEPNRAAIRQLLGLFAEAHRALPEKEREPALDRLRAIVADAVHYRRTGEEPKTKGREEARPTSRNFLFPKRVMEVDHELKNLVVMPGGQEFLFGGSGLGSFARPSAQWTAPREEAKFSNHALDPSGKWLIQSAAFTQLKEAPTLHPIRPADASEAKPIPQAILEKLRGLDNLKYSSDGSRFVAQIDHEKVLVFHTGKRINEPPIELTPAGSVKGISRDGKRVWIESASESERALIQHEVDENRSTRVPTKYTMASQFQTSKDGKSAYFVTSDIASAATVKFIVLDATSVAVRRLDPFRHESIIGRQLSPDGRFVLKIIKDETNPGTEVRLESTETGSVAAIASLTDKVTSFAFSLDEKEIVFVQKNEGNGRHRMVVFDLAAWLDHGKATDGPLR